MTLNEKKMHDILIHFPLYNPVDDVFVGLDEDAVVLPAEEYTYKKPIVFYGSSITQGACASHPGVKARCQWQNRTFKTIRNRQPNLPIIITSAADRMFGIPERKEVIYQTYKNAIEAGDKRVYFIDGDDIYAPVGRGLCTVDHIHPNDIGFLMMANAVEPVIRKILNC